MSEPKYIIQFKGRYYSQIIDQSLLNGVHQPAAVAVWKVKEKSAIRMVSELAEKAEKNLELRSISIE